MKNLHIRLGLSFIAALILSILPMPALVSLFKPPWILILVLYIEYFLPGSFKFSTLLFVGLLLDVLLSTVLGEHSLALLIVTWVASGKTRRFQFFSMTQQMCFIGLFCLFYQSIIALIDALLGFHYSLLAPVFSALLGMFFWPWMCLLGERLLLTRLVYR